MNEQLATIRARRAAVTPGVWVANQHNVIGFASDTMLYIEVDGDLIADCGPVDIPLARADAAFIAAAPADIDTLLAEVERLTGERDEYRTAYLKEQELSASYHVLWQKQEDDIASLTVERDALATGREIQAALIDTLTTQRDALAQQLQQAQDAAKRQAAYISACVDSDGCYRP